MPVTIPESIRAFTIPRKQWQPAYRRLQAQGLLEARVEQAHQLLQRCTLCPHRCGVNRMQDELGVCATGRYALVASYFPHFGEEDCLRGWRGSGTIFFARCNLKCVFCQNFDISRRARGSVPVSPARLAEMMLELQALGCHNINLVTPEHVVGQVVEALAIAIEQGLELPVVYNTSAYDSPESLQLLDGFVDIYMPDFKFWSPEAAKKYLRAEDYPEHARQAILEMYRQVGHLVFDEDGLALRGLLIRHLVMPGFVEDSYRILEWIAEHLGTDTYINIMDQYYPAGMVSANRYPELNRHISEREYWDVVNYALKLGFWRLDVRWR